MSTLFDDLMVDYSYKEFEIPKKNGKTRKICAPSPGLKSAQRKTLKDLYVHFFEYERKLGIEGIVHGFIPGRNVVTIAKRHVGFDSTTQMDISNFFDSVTREHVKMFITNPEDFWFHSNDYTAQGFSTSPILACIATLSMVKSINDALGKVFDDYVFTMYADDLQISIKVPTPDKIKQIRDIITLEVQKAGFKINESKTRTRFAKYGYRRMLGVNVGEDHYRATRKTMRKIRAAKHSQNKSSLGGLTTWSKCPLPKK